MSSESFDAYIARRERDYSSYFEEHPDLQLTSGNIRLFRRTGNPDNTQLAIAFRDQGSADDIDIGKIARTVTVPDWFARDPYADLRSDIMSVETPGPDLDRCRIPPIDRLQAFYLQRAYGASVAWISATYDEKLAREKIWTHLPLLTLNVPVEYVIPVGKLVDDTLSQLEINEIAAEPTEVGIFGCIRPEWVLAIEGIAKRSV
jgi:hypothetical protein